MDAGRARSRMPCSEETVSDRDERHGGQHEQHRNKKDKTATVPTARREPKPHRRRAHHKNDRNRRKYVIGHGNLRGDTANECRCSPASVAGGSSMRRRPRADGRNTMNRQRPLTERPYGQWSGFGMNRVRSIILYVTGTGGAVRYRRAGCSRHPGSHRKHSFTVSRRIPSDTAGRRYHGRTPVEVRGGRKSRRRSPKMGKTMSTARSRRRRSRPFSPCSAFRTPRLQGKASAAST